MASYTLVVSDLHLSNDKSSALFIDFCRQHSNAEQIFILGDLFNFWLGDDVSLAAFPQVVVALKQLDCPVFVMHGNRDFLLGERFAKKSGVILIDEPHRLNVGSHSYLLLHGDVLCSDDRAYQRFRSVVRTPAVKTAFLKLPRALRQVIGQRLRRVSAYMNTKKSHHIMDVNVQSVNMLMAKHPQYQLIHGHTHRQHIHKNRLFTRYVLGDWQPDSGNALKITSAGAQFITVP